jgi:hypothetical protein
MIMRCSWAVSLIFAFVLLPASGWSATGMFQGTVIDPPLSQPSTPGWIFVQGRNHMLRRVEVAHARIEFSSGVPAAQRRNCRMDCLEVGQEIRVTANQDKAGEWRAERVEILHLTTSRI